MAFSFPGRLLPAFLICLALAAPAFSQVNVEKMRQQDVEGFGARFDGDVALLAGNSDQFDLGLGARFDLRRGPHAAFLVGRLRYGASDGDTYKNQAFAHLRYNRRLGAAVVAEAFGQLERNPFTLLRLRALLGAGLRVRHLDGPTVGLFQGTSAMLEREDLDPDESGAHPTASRVVRWSNYASLRLRLTEAVQFSNTVYAQPRVDAFGDVRLLYDAALTVTLTTALALRTGLELSYDSRPPDDIEHTDLSLRNGLTLNF